MVAATALEAAQTRQTVPSGEDAAVRIVADLAGQSLAPDDRMKRIDKQTRETFRDHPQAETIESLSSLGPILGGPRACPGRHSPGPPTSRRATGISA
ncbi:hypothetical protein ACFW9I_32220 [[Kitasatospora] papulosa]|uniref:hypothetical protein n=1 Tax=[Kitasatospora] papulosa TaxID=1464011 RepID=UPI0036B08B3F